MSKTKPKLRNERICGSRACVTTPHETRKAGTKLKPTAGSDILWNASRKLFIGYRDPVKKVLVRVLAVRIDDGIGLDDEQEGVSLNERIPIEDQYDKD
jgi:hypothetical protein